LPGWPIPGSPDRVARLGIVAAAVLAVAAGVGPGWAAPIADREVLPNGIVLLVAERPAIPIVAVRVFHRAGAVFDPSDRPGLANLTGSLLTRGAGSRSAQEIDAAIEFVGGRLEAGGGRDGLTASLAVLARDLKLGLDLLADVVRRPAFPEAELKRKIAEIQAAIQRSEESPEVVASRALARLVFPDHPYGRPVEGTRESVGRLTREDVVGFWREHVRPDATVIGVVGAVTRDQVRQEILARFGDWPRPSGPAPTTPGRASEAAPRSETITRELTQATIMLGRQAVNQTDADYYPLSVASYILGGGSASRLYSRVREEGGLAYSVFSYLTPGRYGGALTMSAQTRTAEVGRVIRIFREEQVRLGQGLPSERELGLAKSYLVGSFPLRLDTSAKVADFIVAVEEMGLGLDYADRYRERIGRVTGADVQRVAARYFAPDSFNRVVVGAGP
jgi:zinc protease